VNIELLVDAAEFWPRLQDDLRDAQHRAYIQTFTFEGDRVGTALARALERSPAADRRLLVDAYSLLYHSDRLIPGPAWFDRGLRREVMLTHRWVKRLRQGGTSVQFSNPLGPSPLNLLRRNHKKIAVFDDRIAYLGGINFSDHNFAWHDMMLRVESEDLARLLTQDFVSTWDRKPLSMDRQVGPFRVLGLNGRGNRARLKPIFDAIRSATATIDVSSAYISYPFTITLAQAILRGVRVRVLTPEKNNKSNLARHILEASRRHGFEVLRYAGGMSHMKAMVIDDEMLIAGSSNFDFMSYHILEELVVMTRDAQIMSEFKERVWNPDFRSARTMVPRSSPGTRLGHAAVRIGAAIASGMALPQGESGA